ncbi:hypothetical protein [Streptomyces sp. NPDC058694]|uniref:hypothetical protein n=1 Tax=unclassified Streptomyces TaxID=2593676 RepID=UPI003660CA73
MGLRTAYLMVRMYLASLESSTPVSVSGVHVRDRAVLQEAFRVVLNDSPEFLTSRGWRWDELSPVGSQDELTAPPTL